MVKCEICGSSAFIKKDGVFVCRQCETEYAPEELRKLAAAAPDPLYDSLIDEISSQDFSAAENGYSITEVDAFLNQICDALDRDSIHDTLSWQIIFNRRFARETGGYNKKEVDAFLDEISDCLWPGKAVERSNRLPLRILSLIFAIGLLLASIGLGGRIYFNRSLSDFCEIVEMDNPRMTGKARSKLGETLEAAIRLDVRGFLTSFAYLAQILNSGNSSIADAAKVINQASDEEMAQARDQLKMYVSTARQLIGDFRYALMENDVHRLAYYLAGGILALLALCGWIYGGGSLSNIRETTWIAALIAGVIGIAAVLIISVSVSTWVDEIIHSALAGITPGSITVSR